MLDQVFLDETVCCEPPAVIEPPEVTLYDLETDPFDHPFKNGSIKTASGRFYSNLA